MDTTANITIKHVGFGPSGTAAYVVLDGRGEYIKQNGQFLFSGSQAEQVAAEAR